MKKIKKIFYFDLHIAVVQEFQDIIDRVCPADVNLDGWLCSNHAWLLNRSPSQVDVINEKTWKKLDKKRILTFQKKYDFFLSQFDAFFVGYPSAFVLLFAKYKKPIIMYNCVRYDMPFCWNYDQEMLDHLNETLQQLDRAALLKVVSNNLADHDYFQSAPHGVQSAYIPTLGEYTKTSWVPKQQACVMYSGEHLLGPVVNLVPRSQIGVFSYKDLMSYSASAHIPYEISTMSMAEQYSAGMPLLFPTQRFYQKIVEENNNLLNSRYWFHKRSWFHKRFNRYPYYLKESHVDDFPSWWIKRADFYTHYPHVTYFDSLDELADLVQKNHITQLKRPTATDLLLRRKEITNSWRNILKELNMF